MDEKATAAVWGALVADALSLGSHWVYNTHVIDKKFGRPDRYLDPLTSYHKGKKAGDFTHYGDQTLLLLESLARDGGFEAGHFESRWQQFFTSYDGYFDKATKATLDNLSNGVHFPQCGSDSDDLGGAARIAPLVCAYATDLGRLVAASRDQTALSHNNPLVVHSAEFFARTAVKCLQGSKPSEALLSALEESAGKSALTEWVDAGRASVATETRAAIGDFGQMCEVGAAFPATIHLIFKYEHDFKDALVENVMAGGDSAARGLLAGMVLGAYHGLHAIPRQWLDGLTAADRIAGLLAQISG
jgi:ADP-ribosylglycohydrolase